MKKPENQILVIFGASGDLTWRKLIPAIYDLKEQTLLPENFAVLGVSRSEFSDDKFRRKMIDGIKKFSNYKEDGNNKPEIFAKKLFYLSIDTANPEDYANLNEQQLHFLFSNSSGTLFKDSIEPRSS
jgi:glucose-6-phosphate 1-dehydrogenase